MILKVTGIAESGMYNNYKERPTTKYYQTKVATKGKIKRDFGLMLDSELKKLRVDILV